MARPQSRARIPDFAVARVAGGERPGGLRVGSAGAQALRFRRVDVAHAHGGRRTRGARTLAARCARTLQAILSTRGSGRFRDEHQRHVCDYSGEEAMSGLAERDCVPCKGGIPPLTAPEIAPLLAQLSGWEAVRGHHLVKTYTFKNFADALAFVDRIGAMAEQQWHHPDLQLA